jgi:hypothetical protein
MTRSAEDQAAWEAACNRYIEQVNKAAENGMKGWEHANCDHAYGYCAG